MIYLFTLLFNCTHMRLQLLPIYSTLPLMAQKGTDVYNSLVINKFCCQYLSTAINHSLGNAIILAEGTHLSSFLYLL